MKSRTKIHLGKCIAVMMFVFIGYEFCSEVSAAHISGDLVKLAMACASINLFLRPEVLFQTFTESIKQMRMAKMGLLESFSSRATPLLFIAAALSYFVGY